MKTVLFRPFDAPRWLGIAFAAWLSTLDRVNPTVPVRFFGKPENGDTPFRFPRLAPAEFLSRLQQHLTGLVGVILLCVLVGVALWLVLLWLSSRGHFLFLASVVRNRASLGTDWREFRRHARSLFRWRVGFSVVAWGGVLASLLGAGWVVYLCRGDALAMPVAFGATVAWLLAVGLALVLIKLFLVDFVTPLMFLFGLSVTEAWIYFGKLLRMHPAAFAHYLFLKSILYVLSLVVATAAIVLTCCFAALPFFGTLLLLPVVVFFRTFSLSFLGAFHPDFRLGPPAPAPHPADAGTPNELPG